MNEGEKDGNANKTQSSSRNTTQDKASSSDKKESSQSSASGEKKSSGRSDNKRLVEEFAATIDTKITAALTAFEARIFPEGGKNMNFMKYKMETQVAGSEIRPWFFYSEFIETAARTNALPPKKYK